MWPKVNLKKMQEWHMFNCARCGKKLTPLKRCMSCLKDWKYSEKNPQWKSCKHKPYKSPDDGLITCMKCGLYIGENKLKVRK